MISKSEQIIHTDLMETRQSNKCLGRYHAFSAFVVCIGSLRNIDLFSELSLREVGIFS